MYWFKCFLENFEFIIIFPVIPKIMCCKCLKIATLLMLNGVNFQNHRGSLNSGHYTAVVRNQITKQWLLFDDDVVAPIDVDLICSKYAFILYFQKDSLSQILWYVRSNLYGFEVIWEMIWGKSKCCHWNWLFSLYCCYFIVCIFGKIFCMIPILI